MPVIDHFADVMLTRILWTSLQALVLIGIVALLVRTLPRLPASARCALWWLVALQLVLGLCAPTPIGLPWLAPAQTSSNVIVQRASTSAQDQAATVPASTASGLRPAMPTTGNDEASHLQAGLASHWQLWFLGLWALGLAAQLPGLVLQRRSLHRLLRAAKPADARLQAACDALARTLGLRTCPDVRVSPGLASPSVAGLLHPVILWPAEQALTGDESAAALAHELAHIQRGDLWFAGVPTLAQWLFWFHPLARRAAREYALYREAACDAVALQHSGTPHDYGSLLLRMGVQQPSHAILAGASPTFRNLKRRLGLLEQHGSTSMRRAGWGLVLIVLAAALPYRLVAAAANGRPVDAAPAGITSTPVPPPPVPPAPPEPPTPPAPPAPPPPPPTEFHASNVDIDTDSSAQRGIILFGVDSVLVKGNQADRATADRLYKKSHGPMLWFRRGDHAWITRDPATVRQALAINDEVTVVRRDAAKLEGRKWRVKGPLEGLRDRQQDVDARIRELRNDPDAPAASARLASLHRQKTDIATRTAGLQRQLAALQPQLDAMARREQQANDRADLRIQRLVEQAVAAGKAQSTTP